ncbi:MAG: 2TM domain-containing protein [Hyphomicrobiaceae bacterium]
MNEHARTARAAQEVDVRIGFYVHFVVFVLVCTILAVVNWLATPEIWWAQWPFVGWAFGVLGHALCAFGGCGPNFITQWRLRKIRQMSHPETARVASGGSSSPGMSFGIFLLGALIGGGAVGGYMYKLLEEARANAHNVEASRNTLDKSLKDQETRLKQLSAEKSAMEVTAKEMSVRVDQLQSSTQAAEAALKKARDELAQAQSAREAAERALADAKKGTSQ